MEITDSLFKKLNKHLTFVLENPFSSFYREKYQKNGERLFLRKPSDFLKIPFLTRQEIVESPASKRQFVKDSLIKVWTISSGTTRHGPLVIPKMIIHKEDWEYDVIAQNMEKLGVKKVMALTSPTNFGNGRIRLWSYHKKLSKYPFISGMVNNLSLSAKFASSIGIEGIETSSSILNYFIPFLKETYDLSKIKLVILMGEYTSEQKLKFFQSYFKNAFFHLNWGGTEFPVCPGFRCQYLANQPPRFFHPNTKFYHFEVIDSKGGVLNEEERGELVITTTKECAFPLIRYKTGDEIIYYQDKCQCKEKAVIEHFGRIGYDFIKVAGGMIHAEMVDKALSKSKVEVGQYQLHIYEVLDNRQLKMKLVLELPHRDGLRLNNLKKKLPQNFYLSRSKTLVDLINKGIFLPLEIKFVEEWEERPKTIKIVSHLK